jgi:hypothetical protein
VIIKDFLAIMGSKILNSSIKVIHPGTLLYWNVADKIRKFQGSCVYEDEGNKEVLKEIRFQSIE